MKLSDIPMPDSVENEVRDAFYELRLLLNNGQYQLRKATVLPGATDSGNQGDILIVTSGNDGYIAWYDGSNWWYVAGTKIT